MAEKLVVLDVHEGVATLTLNDEARLNALTRPLGQAALAALEQVASDRSVRALVLRASGRLFSVGADLSALNEPREAPAVIDELLREVGNPLVRALRECPVPVLAVVQGPVAGGGVGLCLAADVVIAARSAYFYLPFVPALGLVPDMGAAHFMQRAIGASRSAALMLLGERLTAEQAAQWGLIRACVDDAALDGAAADIARRLAALPAHGIREVRALLDGVASRTLAQELDYERQRQTALAADPCFAEGVRAFLQKRRPEFPAR